MIHEYMIIYSIISTQTNDTFYLHNTHTHAIHYIIFMTFIIIKAYYYKPCFTLHFCVNLAQ